MMPLFATFEPYRRFAMSTPVDKPVSTNKPLLTASTWVGLALPLLGMPLSYFVTANFLQSMERNSRTLVSSLITFGLAAGVVAVVLLWEKQKLSALGIRPQTRRSIIIALSASIVIAVGGTLISLGLFKLLNLPLPTMTTERITGFPLWLALWIVISSSIAEEVLFRGFVLERLGQVTGSIWIGGLITLAWFTLLHLPLGLSYTLLIVLPTSIMITLFYIWRRDLIATITVHLVFNAPIAAVAFLFWLAQR
jgi:membrane protease YdiL (CAAX protease family)